MFPHLFEAIVIQPTKKNFFVYKFMKINVVSSQHLPVIVQCYPLMSKILQCFQLRDFGGK